MVSKFNRFLSLLAAGLLAGCDSPNTLQLTGGEPSASPGEGGVVRLQFHPGPVGVVAGRSMAAPSKRILIHFKEIREDTAVGRSLYDTLLFWDRRELSQEYRFTPGTRWKVSASVNDYNWSYYQGEAEFAVESGRTTDVILDMKALFAVGRFRIPVIDSMTRFVMVITNGPMVDYPVSKQTQVGSVLEFAVEYIPASPKGVVSYFSLFVEGEMWGETYTLYSMTDTIRVVSGESVSLQLGLTWVGPNAPPPSGANLQIRFETPMVTLVGDIHYRDTTGARANTFDFLDPRTGETYPYKRIGNQTWMLRNIGGPCFDVLDSFLINRGTCEYGTLFTDTEAEIDLRMLNYAPIPAKDYKHACPTGWHVPDTSEWHELVRFAANGESDSVGAYRLRTREGWWGRYPALGVWYADVAFNGSDEFGFSLHPSQLYRNGYMNFKWHEAQLFTSTPGCRVVIFDNHGFKGCSDFHFESFYPNNTYAASVRCIKDLDE